MESISTAIFRSTLAFLSKLTKHLLQALHQAGTLDKRITAGLALSLWVLSSTLAVLSILLQVLIFSYPNVHIFDYWAVLAVVTVTSSTVGAVIASHRPENPVGWVYCAIGFFSGVRFLSAQYATYALLAMHGALPGGQTATWISAWSTILFLGLYVFVGLLFPDGCLPSSRWRGVAWISAVVTLTGAVLVAFSPGPVSGLGSLQNPLGVDLLRITGANFSNWVLVESLLEVLMCVAAASLFMRLRYARGVERQQLKWVTYTSAVQVSGVFLSYLVPLVVSVPQVSLVGFVLTILGLLSFPVSMAIAILKYRLYDVDILINRTLVYGVLTTTLILMYFSNVTLLEGLLHALLTKQETQIAHSQLAVVASTLAIAGLFTPLRRRVQLFIDRLFYRRKYDVTKTLEAFGAKLRDEVDLQKLTSELVAVIDETVQPVHVSLWLRPPQPESNGEHAKE